MTIGNVWMFAGSQRSQTRAGFKNGPGRLGAKREDAARLRYEGCGVQYERPLCLLHAESAPSSRHRPRIGAKSGKLNRLRGSEGDPCTVDILCISAESLADFVQDGFLRGLFQKASAILACGTVARILQSFYRVAGPSPGLARAHITFIHEESDAAAALN
ncbi:uncharacterized protein CIMG_13529 [Coccidioides immitis RS]|uniref:Uncharacterized protein n=1 Tax=Coccidioides immitis (strain RS) TaxID=246410 RepID=J3K0L4_COCIM|nr:uncharacterized protein CIMG_13529 [Coccidioides immitis RS]EAS27398.3 hypothetical protein CIMG_13529 [Coccidioides immitis RS]